MLKKILGFVCVFRLYLIEKSGVASSAFFIFHICMRICEKFENFTGENSQKSFWYQDFSTTNYGCLPTPYFRLSPSVGFFVGGQNGLFAQLLPWCQKSEGAPPGAPLAFEAKAAGLILCGAVYWGHPP